MEWHTCVLSVTTKVVTPPLTLWYFDSLTLWYFLCYKILTCNYANERPQIFQRKEAKKWKRNLKKAGTTRSKTVDLSASLTTLVSRPRKESRSSGTRPGGFRRSTSSPRGDRMWWYPPLPEPHRPERWEDRQPSQEWPIDEVAATDTLSKNRNLTKQLPGKLGNRH